MRLAAFLLMWGLASSALADDFAARQQQCNAANLELKSYVTKASGFTNSQNSDSGYGTLTHDQVDYLNYRYWAAIKDITWLIRDTAFTGDVARCLELKREGIKRVDAIIHEQFGP